jgi:hemerythrin superfamily protein
MPELSKHDEHNLLEIKHNLSALDIESIIPWSTDVIFEHQYFRLQEAAALAAFKLTCVDSVLDQQRVESIRSQLVVAINDTFINELISTGVKKAREDRRLQWTHSA